MNLVLVRLTRGGFSGLLAALLYALVADFIRVPIPPLAFFAVSLAAGAAAGLASAMLARLDVKGLLIRADKALRNRELSSTAFELDCAGKSSIYSEAIIEDAAASLSGADPAALLGRPRLPLLPSLPVLLAGAILLSVVPLDLAGLFFPKPRPEPAIRLMGEDLESFGKQLEKRAAERNLSRQLELSRELQKLGQDFQNQKIDQGEAAERLSEMENKLAQEYELALKPFSETRPGEGRGGKGERGGAKDGTEGGDSKGKKDNAQGGKERSSAGSGGLRQDLGEALDMLSEKKKGLGGNSSGFGDDTVQGIPDDRESRGKGPGEKGEGKEGLGSGGSGSDYASGSKPGTAPAEQKTGPPTDIQTSGKKDALRAKAPESEGDKATLLMRALPKRTGSRVPDAELLKRYERTAESALAREEVPLALQDYVKQYFITIGMLGKDSEGR